MEINALTGEFADRTTEAAFLAYKLPQTRALLGFTLASCGLFFLFFFATDLASVHSGPTLTLLFFGRLTAALTAGVCSWLAYRRSLQVAATRWLASISKVVVFGCFMLVSMLRPHEYHWHAMSMSVMLSAAYLYIPNRLAYAVALSLGATALFTAMAREFYEIHPADSLTMSMLLLLANVFGALAARRFNIVSREEYRAHTVFKHAAERDHLTGCHNRRYLHEHLMGHGREALPGRARRLAVLLCDIDHFKQINDTYGHADGDAVLRAFAALLRERIRLPEATVVRYGGEEFLAVLPGMDLDGGVRLAEQLRATFAAMQTPSADGALMLRTTASFGVAATDLPQGAGPTTLRDLISAADKLMYQAKRNGRDRVEALQLAR